MKSKGRGIRVNVISPGAIDTPIIDSQAPTPEGAEKYIKGLLRPRRWDESDASMKQRLPRSSSLLGIAAM
jgi:NAD(P)-dependent dehydrogenase (short-subunit alcohol dehydrogenase family)